MITEEQKRAKHAGDMLKWRHKNPEKWKAIRARYRAKNQEKIAKYRRLYYEVNREKEIAESIKWMREWRAAHPEKYRLQGREQARRWRAANPERQRANEKAWNDANPERRQAINARYRAANGPKRRDGWRAWRDLNREKVAILKWLRSKRTREATPSWVNREALRAIKVACPEGCQVDHIVPLRGITPEGYLVCGLHVPWNLQYLPTVENAAKGNRMAKQAIPH